MIKKLSWLFCNMIHISYIVCWDYTQSNEKQKEKNAIVYE